jgi:hypothetical protein
VLPEGHHAVFEKVVVGQFLHKSGRRPGRRELGAGGRESGVGSQDCWGRSHDRATCMTGGLLNFAIGQLQDRPTVGPCAGSVGPRTTSTARNLLLFSPSPLADEGRGEVDGTATRLRHLINHLRECAAIKSMPNFHHIHRPFKPQCAAGLSLLAIQTFFPTRTAILILSWGRRRGKTH